MKLLFLYYCFNRVICKQRQGRIAQIGEQDYYSQPRKYAGCEVLPLKNAQDWIAEKIQNDVPFMLGRFGSVELMNMATHDTVWKEDKLEKAVSQLANCAGFFPVDKSRLGQFVNVMKDSCQFIDMLAIWNLPMEEYYIRTYMSKDAKLTWLGNIEPWYCFNNPWTKSLAGKKVLVVHPFIDTIQKQYEVRDKLWGDTDILPEFQLKTLKAVQTLAGEEEPRFSTWFEALDYMEQEALAIDFEVALIGCGAYGFPLAARLKKAGKKAVHFGGSLQILFGIRGKRWDKSDLLKQYYNEYWVRPGEQELPKKANTVENGCYW